MFAQRSFLILPLVCLVLFSWIAVTETNESVFIFINHSYQYFDGAAWDRFWQNITIFGDALIAVAILLPLAAVRPELLRVVLCAIISTTLVVQLLKSGLQIPRPLMLLELNDVHVIGAGVRKRAFPSGHTATIFVMAAVLIRYFRLNIYSIAAVMIAAIFVGVSRIIVGVHWPMDVLAGAAIGWVCGYLSVCAMKHCPPVSVKTHVLILSAFFLATAYLLLYHHMGYPQAMLLQKVLAALSLLLTLYGLVCTYKKRV